MAPPRPVRQWVRPRCLHWVAQPIDDGGWLTDSFDGALAAIGVKREMPIGVETAAT
jgi:hypothetical protein